jgi:CRISPR/Cas system-associated exonuclease Cas4 (RecB family)
MANFGKLRFWLVCPTQAIRADGYIPPGIIIEIKTHPPLEANKYALAGYALAYESQHNTPINYGVFIQEIPHNQIIIQQTPKANNNISNSTRHTHI